jgi:hypothetical protein
LTAQTNKSKTTWVLIPLFGSLLFILFYILAAYLYPGGSETDKTSVGFSWTNNYWCNLLHENAINGQPNSAKPVAITGMLILCLALSAFWLVFPTHLNTKKYFRLTIQISGIGAMVSSFFLLTNINHDLIVNIASCLGLIAIIGTLACLYQTKWYGLFVFGLFNILLVGLNNYLYNTEGMMIYLPVVQKISFLSFIVWICFINMNLYQRAVKVL